MLSTENCLSENCESLVANNADPDQTPFSTASDLALHCLLKLLLYLLVTLTHLSLNILVKNMNKSIFLCVDVSDWKLLEMWETGLTLIRHRIVLGLKTKNKTKYSRLSLSRSPRDSLKYFEISVPRHNRFAELRHKPNNRISQMNTCIYFDSCTYWKYCGKEEKLLLRSNFSFPQYFVTCC